MSRLSLVLLLPLLAGPTLVRASDGIREVQYDDRSLVSIQARLRITTTIVLPEGETILDYICGDKDFWIINGSQNLAHVKPARAGAWTNLNLVTSSGRIYSFRLQEGAETPDMKVFVTVPPGTATTKRYHTADEVDAVRAELAAARAAADAAKQAAIEAIEAQRQAYPTRLRFDYRFARDKQPFAVSAIWHDGVSTFIRSGARELPALYEEQDHAPSIVNYQVHDGTYVIPKVLDRGYLMLGKAKLEFRLVNR